MELSLVGGRMEKFQAGDDRLQRFQENIHDYFEKLTNVKLKVENRSMR